MFLKSLIQKWHSRGGQKSISHPSSTCKNKIVGRKSVWKKYFPARQLQVLITKAVVKCKSDGRSIQGQTDRVRGCARRGKLTHIYIYIT